MTAKFNADEVFEMAEEMERAGAKYYRDAAAREIKQSVRDLLLKLAEMEDDHLEEFGAMRDEYRRREHPPETFDPDSEAASYLRESVEKQVFNDKNPAKHMVGNEDEKAVLARALAMEQEAIVFYTHLKEMVPEELGKNKVQWIINQEIQHVALITRELAAARS